MSAKLQPPHIPLFLIFSPYLAIIFLSIELWGLDEDGHFHQSHHQSAKVSSEITSAANGGLLTRLKSLVTKKNTQLVSDMIHSELESIEKAILDEKYRFKYEFLSEKEKGKRLLFLFQRDLMPGINGQILESKDKREDVMVKGTSRSAKILGWCFIALLDAAMLFYVLLFALSQDTHKQKAWGQSFALWLVLEILVISSFAVMLTHVLIPAITMKDVSNIKKKLMENVMTYYQTMAQEHQSHGDHAKLNVASSSVPGSVVAKARRPEDFNAAEYLFLSYRLAELYPELKVSKIIKHFHTPWPKQSYHHAIDVTKNYDKKFSALNKSFSMVIMFFLSSLISVPVSIQDMVIQMATTTTAGYTVLLHIQLYTIYPVLVIIPTIFIGVIVHFVLQANKAQQELEQKKLMAPKNSKNAAIASTAAALPGERQSGQPYVDDKVSDSHNISSFSGEEDDVEQDDDEHLHLSVPSNFNKNQEKKLKLSDGEEKAEKKEAEEGTTLGDEIDADIFYGRTIPLTDLGTLVDIENSSLFDINSRRLAESSLSDELYLPLSSSHSSTSSTHQIPTIAMVDSTRRQHVNRRDSLVQGVRLARLAAARLKTPPTAAAVPTIGLQHQSDCPRSESDDSVSTASDESSNSMDLSEDDQSSIPE